MRPRKYAWERWFGSARTVLVRGTDYNVTQSAMVQQIRSNASARGLRVRILDNDDHIVIERRDVVGVPAPEAPLSAPVVL